MLLYVLAAALPAYPPAPLVAEALVHVEKDGIVAVEAEHFNRQSANRHRAWHVRSAAHHDAVPPDHDDAPYSDASGEAYVEALPDLFHEESDPIIEGQNLGGGGAVAVLHYRVRFATPGVYHVWSRLRSNDQEDNTMEAGINGVWPATAHILQSPVNRKAWVWQSDNRISRTPWKIGRATIVVSAAGEQDIQFAMREDGEEFDKFVLALDPAFVPGEPFGPRGRTSGPRPPRIAAPLRSPAAATTTITPDGSRYGANALFALRDRGITIEAEDYYRQEKMSERAWHVVSAETVPAIGPDSDPPHVAGASAGAYLELLPDLRQKDEDARHNATSIHKQGGQAAILSWAVRFAKPGRYAVWVRGLGVDGDDNTVHVGLNDSWPESGNRLLLPGKTWAWSNRQRDTGAPVTVTVGTAGVHMLQLSMREDGAEIDRLFIAAVPDQGAGEVPNDVTLVATVPAKGSLDRWRQARAALPPVPATREKAGVLLFEAESAPAPAGWRYHAAGTDHSGAGHLRWDEAGQGIKPGRGLLSYRFVVEKAGRFQLLLRGKLADPANRPDTPDPDGNDVWLRIVRDGEASEAPWIKAAILGHPEGWTWNSNADAGPPHPATPIVQTLAPGLYHLQLSGRSQGYAIDRIALLRLGQGGVRTGGLTDWKRAEKLIDQAGQREGAAQTRP